MAPRVRLKTKEAPSQENLYFPVEASNVFIPTGCTLLDCVLGGGWPLRRIANIVGDRSTGKTLLAIEACANFARKFPRGKIFYREAEAAFDEEYARQLGLPVDRVDFGRDGLGTPWDTIEDIFEDMDACLQRVDAEGLYIVDSLDALSSRAEMARDVDKGTFGLEKQKVLGKLFRQLTRRISTANTAVIIISQVRDNIGVAFGEKHKRTGGRALDFYATHALWLSHMGTDYRTIGGVKRATGVQIKAKCKKNKIGPPLRECEFDIEFGYGVRDVEASIDWLAEVKELGRLGLSDKSVTSYLKGLDSLSDAELIERQQLVRDVVIRTWAEIEGKFAPPRRKYA